MEYETEKELLEQARKANGKTFNEIDQTNRLSQNGKGNLGQIVEEGIFNYEVNSNPLPDFENLGIELKVTPVKQNKNGTLSAKERLVLNIINYMEEYKYNFKTSSFWMKNQRLLIMFYLWQKELERKDYRVIKSILFDYPEEDLEIIKQDWETIVNKIKEGKAHELSEGDTNYLGACTKGASRKSVRVQPFSDIPAKQRAFSLKQSYMTSIVRKNIDKEKLTKFASASELKKKSLSEILYERFEPYLGMEVSAIAAAVDIPYSKKNKAINANLVSAILGIKGTKLKDIEEFSKANIQFKTIRLEPNGTPKEHMSFETIDFNRWVLDPFEQSQIYERFEMTRFLFAVFEFRETNKKNPNRKLYLKEIKLWNMPEEHINKYVYPMWEDTRQVLKEGVKLTQTKKGVSNNLPGATYNGVVHIRPKAQNAADKVQLPDGQMITKQCYWLDRNYISNLLKDNKNDNY